MIFSRGFSNPSQSMAVFTCIGDEVFAAGGDDDERKRAYKPTIKLASKDNVKLSGIYLRAAA
jgi:hypothetical protein